MQTAVIENLKDKKSHSKILESKKSKERNPLNMAKSLIKKIPSISKTQQEKKNKAVISAIESVKKQFGKESIFLLGDNNVQNIPSISTGCISLNRALGIGGLAKGRIIEIYGPESSGKTTLALQTISQCQKEGGNCAFIDAEHALDLNYAKALGIDEKELLISQPDHGEQALEICETLVRSGGLDLIVVDSVAALVPRAEIEGEMGDSHMGLQARLMSQAMRKLAGIAYRMNCTIIFINQLRQKIGIVFGNPEVTTGGNALKFYASTRIEVRRISSIKKDTEVIGNRTRIKIVKNKLAAPFKITEVDIMYGKGIIRENDILELAEKLNIISKAGSWYSYKGDKIGQGKEKSVQFLKSKPNLLSEIEKEIIRT